MPRTDDAHVSCPTAATRWLRSAHWGRTPTVFRAPPQTALAGEAEIIAGLRALAEGGRTPVIVADGEVLEREREHAWGHRDATLELYAERLRATTSRSSVSCHVDGFEAASRRLWFGCRPILAALYRHVGTPAGGAMLRLQLHAGPGRPEARRTDECHVLCFVAAGAATITARSGAGAQSTFSAAVGDFVYLPPGHEYWESGAQTVRARLELRLSMRAPALADVATITAGAPLEDRFDPFVLGEQPDVVSDRIELLLAGLGHDFVRERLDDALLDRQTRMGFSQPPPRDPAVVTRGQLTPRAAGMLAWRLADARLVVSCNGAGFAVEADPAVLGLLELVNEGLPMTVETLEARLCGADGLDSEDLHALLGCLAQLGAFEASDDQREHHAAAM